MRSRALLPYLATLAVFLPVLLLHSATEGNFWIDESYSVQLANLPLERLVRTTAADVHPPLYYLILKCWLVLWRMVGVEPGVMLGRLPGTMAWLVVFTGSWLVGRRLFGNWPGSLFAICLAGGAQVLWIAKDMRSYSVAHAMVVLAAILMLVLASQEKAETSRRHALLGWGLYGLLASMVMWLHIITGVMLALLACVWLVVTFGKGWNSRFARFGFTAQFLALLSFLPWLTVISGQMENMRTFDRGQSTPSTLLNLAQSFTLSFTFGQYSMDGAFPSRLARMFGVVAVLAPLLAMVAGVVKGRHRDAAQRPLLMGAVFCYFLGIGNVLTIWLIDRLDIVSIFYPSRYLVFSAGLFGGALALGAAWGVANRWSALVVLPWLICGVYGVGTFVEISWRSERDGGDLRLLPPHVLPPPGDRLYVMPAEIIPMQRRIYARWDVRPAAQIAWDDGLSSPTVVLDTNAWEAIDRPADAFLQAAIANKLLSANVSVHEQPQPIIGRFRAYALSDFKPDGLARARRTIEAGGSDTFGIPDDAFARALPTEQLRNDGWQTLEFDGDVRAFRWSGLPPSALRFDRTLPPGSYVFRLRGYRHAYPTEEVDLTLDIPGAASIHRRLTPGGIDVSIPFTLHSSTRRLHVSHPIWRPANFLGGGDRRPLGFVMTACWVEQAK